MEHIRALLVGNKWIKCPFLSPPQRIY